MSEERLDNIETKIAYQEDLLEVLNKTVYEQQKRLQLLEDRCAALSGSLTSLVQAVHENNAATNETPPHY